MWLRRQWIIGVVIIVLVGLTWGQEESAATPENSEAPVGDAADATNTTDTTKKPKLTGIPQIDYIHDPNLPHELRGYNMSEYPFYARLPPDLLLPSFNFTCDNRLDGFYASVPHKCQVYHNCLFGQRYDFLCANFTVFDQKNFICHYVSEVDCANSALHYDRNEELYVTTTTTTSTPAPPQIIYIERPRPQRGQGGRPNRPRPLLGNRRPGQRRTTTTPAPAYYDDYDYDEYYDQYYDDYYNDYANEKSTTTTTTTTPRPRRPNRPQRTRLGGAGGGGEGRSRPSGRFGNIFNAGERKRPRINPPVPVDSETVDESPRASRLQQGSGSRQQAIDDAPVDEPPQDIAQDSPSGPRSGRPGRKPRPGGRPQKKTTTTTTTTSTTETAPNDYYYDYYEYEDETSTTTTTAAPARPSRPSSSRNRSPSLSRLQQNRPQSTTTTTTTEVPVTEAVQGRPSRPNRFNVRKNPVDDRATPIEGAVPLDEPLTFGSSQEPEPQSPRPQHLRLQFPRKRTQNEPVLELDADVIQEDAPLAPGLDLTAGGDPIDVTSLDSAREPVGEAPSGPPSGPRVSLRRIGQGGFNRGPGPRARGPQRRVTPDYSDY